MRHVAVWLKTMLVVLAIVLPTGARAHEIVPAIVDIGFADNGVVSISIRANAEALVAQIGPQHSNTNDSPNAADYDRLRGLEPAAFAATFAEFAPALAAGISLGADGQAAPVHFEGIDVPEVGDTSLARESTIHLSAQLPTGAQSIVWSWDSQFGASIIRVMDGGDEAVYSEYVLDGMTSKPVNVSGPQPRGFLETVGDYMAIGFTHIVPKGVDHILFVVGIFLASTRLKPLLIQVSSFTVAHTVSLALGALGLVVVDPRIVEPLIALSIAYVCIENIWFGHLTVWRP
ncbi:MAG: HupE/UreJ family protein, partial [Hyphomicrobiaceae bacterium]|nr:HupE/UreJ family protein [Hyphomicrobiaceae bacterium]